MAETNGHYTSPYGGLPDPLILNRLDRVTNALSASRSELLSKLTDRRRDIDAECGYPPEPTVEQYKALYNRDPIAARVVEIYPKESWQVTPMVYETEDVNNVTPFEKAWSEVGRSLRGEDSYFQDEVGSPIWEYLLRVDTLSGIGHYGVILLGIDDGATDLSKPAYTVAGAQRDRSNKPVKTGKTEKLRKLLYLRVFDESLAKISRYNDDQNSPRYGHPEMYSLTFNDPEGLDQGGVGLTSSTVEVHWTRVIHVADTVATSSEVFALPRQQQVLNRILDLKKLYGGSAEMYWAGAFPGISIESHPSLGGDVVIDTTSLKTEIEKYFNSLQRYFAVTGATAHTLSPTVVDPKPQIQVQLEALAIEIAVPLRIFKGSERGELASSQDEKEWRKRLIQRQRNYLTPRLIAPFVDRLIRLGVLPRPKGFSVFWPPIDIPSKSEQAELTQARTTAMASYISGTVYSLIAPMDFLVRELGYDEGEAQAVLENADRYIEEQLAKEEAMGVISGEDQVGSSAPDNPSPSITPTGRPNKAALKPEETM